MQIKRWEEGQPAPQIGGVMHWVFWPGSGSRRLSLHHGVKLPGEAIAVHVHEGADDIVSVIQGRGVVVTPQGEFPIEAGQSVWIPAGEPHGFRNTGDGPFVTLGCQSPPDFEMYRKRGFKFPGDPDAGGK